MTEINIPETIDLVNSYNKLIDEITIQLDQLKSEHNANKINISNLIDENKQLGLKLEELYNTPKQPINYSSQENEIISNLKQQIDVILTEKNNTITLYQQSIFQIEQLKTELQLYKNGEEGLILKSEFERVKKSYEHRIKELQDDLVETQQKFADTLNQRTLAINSTHEEIAINYNTPGNSLKIIKNLEKEILVLQERLQSILRNKNGIEIQLKTREKEIETLKSKNLGSTRKVEEAVHLVQAALNEKDAALLRESELKEQLVQLTESIDRFKEESGKKRSRETNALKNEYNEKLNALSAQLTTKTDEVDKLSKKCFQIEIELTNLRASSNPLGVHVGDTSKLLILEKNLEDTFQKLLLAEKKNIQSTSEKTNLQNELEDMTKFYERTVHTKESEKSELRKEIRKLKMDIETKGVKLSELADLCKKHEESEANLRQQLNDNIRNIKEHYDTKLSESKQSDHKIIRDLEIKLETHNETSRKWRNDTKTVILKLGDKVQSQKQKLVALVDENTNLTGQLDQVTRQMLEYKNRLYNLSYDFNKIVDVSV